MPIVSLYCPTDGQVGLDHFETACTKLPMPLPWILGIKGNTIGDTRHSGPSASRLVGCARSSAIEDLLPIPGVDLRKFNSAAHGWAAHAWMAQFATERLLPEQELKGVLFPGTQYEIPVSGHPDVMVFGKTLVIEDYKITSESNQRYQTPLTEKVEWNVQVTIYDRIAPRKFQEAAIWSGAAVPRRSKAEPWVHIPARLLSDEELLNARPFDGESTVAEHILDWKMLAERLKGGMSAEEAISMMPLRGELQMRQKDGRSKCDYCIAADVCAGLVKGGAGGDEI